MGAFNFVKISQNFLLYCTTFDIMIHGSLTFFAIILIAGLIGANDCWTTGWTCVVCFGPFVYFLSQMTISICLTKQIRKCKENHDDNDHNHRLRVFAWLLISTSFLPLAITKIPHRSMEQVNSRVLYSGIVYLVWKIFLVISIYIYSTKERREFDEINQSSQKYSLCSRFLHIFMLCSRYFDGVVHGALLFISIFFLIQATEFNLARQRNPGLRTGGIGIPSDLYGQVLYYGSVIFLTVQLFLAVHFVNSMNKVRNRNVLKMWMLITASTGVLAIILSGAPLIFATHWQFYNGIFLYAVAHITWKSILILLLLIYLRTRNGQVERNAYESDVTNEVNESCALNIMPNNSH